jgi:uncharacterized membrane protein YeaQ/YmgE (transglycosylase-associated protein family)
MGIFSWIVIGLITGWVASRIVNKTGLRMMIDTALGVIGAVLGGSLASFLRIAVVAGDTIGGVMMAALGAVVVLLAYDVLEASLPEVDAGFAQFVSKLRVGIIGEANPPGLSDALDPRILAQANPVGHSDPLNPRGDIDAVAHQTAVGLFDNIAQMNADPKFDATVLRRARVALDHRISRLDLPVRRDDHAAKRDDRAVAVSGLPDAI